MKTILILIILAMTLGTCKPPRVDKVVVCAPQAGPERFFENPSLDAMRRRMRRTEFEKKENMKWDILEREL